MTRDRLGSRRQRALARSIVVGSRTLNHRDAGLIGYTFATVFAAFAIALRPPSDRAPRASRLVRAPPNVPSFESVRLRV
jgi:hypothetical protein